MRWLKARWEMRRLRRLYIEVARQHFRKLDSTVAQGSDQAVLLAALDLAVQWLNAAAMAAQAGKALGISSVNSETKEPPAVLH